MKFLYDKDIAQPPLQGRRVAVIGFGNQGCAHAENLRDSGVDVVVGLRSGSRSRHVAEAAGIRVLTLEEAADWADIVALLIPDEEQAHAYERYVGQGLKKGDALLFAHGFAIHFGLITPPPEIDVVLAAPKGPGHQVRSEYLGGRGVVMLTAVHQNGSGNAGPAALEYAAAIGGGRAGIFESSFREECETDLFGEQAVICGGLSHLIMAGFETLVKAGYQPELAYFECLHEVKLIADLVHRFGITGMREAISNTAEFGDLTRGPRIVGPGVKEEMRKVLEEIRSGQFAAEWIEENKAGRPRFRRLFEKGAGHPIEEVGARLRNLMPSPGQEHAGAEASKDV